MRGPGLAFGAFGCSRLSRELCERARELSQAFGPAELAKACNVHEKSLEYALAGRGVYPRTKAAILAGVQDLERRAARDIGSLTKG